ncbi:hypothetical protein niasHS_006176 [Heterodera schachtii]|uniref:polynucleotide adenylyltransferase n=1 Tax=Heterodera schachtii TaxID=97005 RepID=A0ABD2JSD1_HETSC
MDTHYADILFNDHLSLSDRSNLAYRIGGAIVHLNVERNLDLMENACQKTGRKIQNASLLIMGLMKEQFGQMIEDFGKEHQQKTFSRFHLCLLWKMELSLDNLKKLLMSKANLDKLLDPEHLDSINCEELENVLSQAQRKGNKIELPQWTKDFGTYFSDLHFYGLHLSLNAEGSGKKFKMSDWLGQNKLDGETTIAHSLRTMHLRGEMGRIKEIKRRMVRHLISHFQLERLEMIHPIRMAAGHVDEQTMSTYYEMMFCQNIRLTEELLEYAILCSQIFAYFLHQNGANKTKENDANWWQKFVHSTRQIILFTNDAGATEKLAKKEDVLGTLHELWHNIKDGDNFDEKALRKGSQIGRELVENLAKCLMEIYAENKEFRKCFGEQRERRRTLEQMLRKAEKELGGRNSETEKTTEPTKEPKKQQQQGGTSADDSAMILLKINDICPDKRIPLKEIETEHFNKKELFSYTLMKQYVELLLADRQSVDKELETIESKAIIFYYLERVRGLFRKAIIVQPKMENEQFMALINNYLTQWESLMTECQQNAAGTANGWAQLVCKCYQFIHKLVTDKQLKEMNAEWHKLVGITVKEWNGTMLTELISENMMSWFGKSILLSDNGQKRQWHKMRCADAQNANALVAKFRKCRPLLDMFHLYTLIYLLSEFDEMRSIFCFETVHKIATMKQRMIVFTSSSVLDRMEMLFPSVLRFNLLTNTQLISMLMNQFIYQSGTEEAQFIEARNVAPVLIGEILDHEDKLSKNMLKPLKNLPEMREILLHKIKATKRAFLSKLGTATYNKSVLREAICPPLFLYLRLKSIAMGISKIKRGTDLSQWQPNSACNTVEGVQRSFDEARVLFKFRICQFFANNPNDFRIFLQNLAENPGAKTKFLKLISADAVTKLLPDSHGNPLVEALWAADEMAMDEVFYGNLQLGHLFLTFLTTYDSVQWLCYKIKLDLFIFVRWIDSQVTALLILGNSFSAQRCAKFWVRCKVLILQLYDRYFDEQMEEMPNLQIFQYHFLSHLNFYFEKILDGKIGAKKSEKAMNDELRKIVQNSQKVYEEDKMMVDSFVSEEREQYERFEMALAKLRIKTVNELAHRNEYIKEALGHFLSKMKELPDFVGKDTIIQTWRAIASEHFEELGKKLEEKYGKKTAEMKPKKKKPKRKKNKNGKTEAKKGDGEKETEAATDTVVIEEGSTVSGVGTNEEAKEGTEMSTVDVDTVEENMETANTEEEALENKNNCEINRAEKAVRNGHNESLAPVGGDDQRDEEDKSQQENTNEGSESAAAANGGTKLKEFADDDFLAQKYAQFVHTFMMEEQQNGDGICQLIRMLTVGAFVNEISHRLDAIEWMGGDQWQNVKKKRTFLWWKSILADQYSAADLVEQLYEFLREIWREMEEIIGRNLDKLAGNKKEQIENESDQRRGIELISRQINSRKFGRAIIGGKVKNWDKMPKNQKEKALLSLFGSHEDGIKNAENGNKIVGNFERKLELLEKAFAQQKLDQMLFEQYKNNENLTLFIEMKDKINFNGKNAQIFPTEKWQELKFTEENDGKLKEIEKLKSALKLRDSEQKVAQKLLIKLNEIFNGWSAEAQFQPSVLHFLKNSVAKLEPICILPGGFDQKLVFGQATECDQSKREQCSDQSLYCTLCKALNVTFIQKYLKNDLIFVPMLQIEMDGVQIEVKFIEIPGFVHIPRIKFTARQMEVFLLKFGQNIENLENSDHFDEGVYWHEIGKRKELRKKYENDADKLKQFDQITELFNQSRKMALNRRALVKERKETLFVLADFTMHLKLLELLLPKNYYLSMFNKHNKLGGQFAVGILDKFRTIFAFLERWAQNNFIYCENLGYLNDEMLLIMLAKVFLLFPDSSVSFLVDKFFLIYSKWKWPMAIQLTQIAPDKIVGEFLSWAPGKEWLWRRKLAWENLPKIMRKEKIKGIRKELAMALITPTFPERNVAEKVNVSSAKVVQNELDKAWDKMRRNGTDQRQQKEAIFEPIYENKFSEKYDHFIVVECKGPTHNVDKFHDFVGNRLRYELLEFVEKPLALWVRFCHVFPKVISPSSDECSAKKGNDSRNALCTRLWLVGIELEPKRPNNSFKSKMKANLKKKFDERVKSDFQNGLFQNVWLKSEIAERKDLQKWGIDPKL